MAELSETVQSVKQATRKLADPNRFIRLNQSLKSWCAIITETKLPFSNFSPFDCLPEFKTQKISGSRSIKGIKNKEKLTRNEDNDSRVNFSDAQKIPTLPLKVNQLFKFNQQKKRVELDSNLEEIASSRQLTGLTAKIKANIAKLQTPTKTQIQSLQQIVSDAQVINMLNGLTVRETCRQILDSSNIIDNALKYNKAEDAKNRDNQVSASLLRKTRDPYSKKYDDVRKLKSKKEIFNNSHLDVPEALEPQFETLEYKTLEHENFDPLKTNIFMGTDFKKSNLPSSLPLNQSLERMDILTNNILDNYKKAEQNNSCAEQRGFPKYSAANLLRDEFTQQPETYETYPEEIKENFSFTNNKSSTIQKQDSSGRHENKYNPPADQETAEALVNQALIKQAKRHGVDLS